MEKLTKYERARIIGARALQIAMNAPLLIKISEEELEKLNFDAIRIAEVELESGALPISVKRPMPEKVESALKRPKSPKVTDEKKEAKENEEEKEIIEEEEIMELANPEDEIEEDNSDDEREE